MRKRFDLPVLLIALVSTQLLGGVANGGILMLEDFEDSTVHYTASQGEFFDTGNDHFAIVPLGGNASPADGPYTGFAGSHFFSAEDIDDPQGPGFDTQTLTFDVDIRGATNLTFGGMFAAGANDGSNASSLPYDDEDGLVVRAQIDGGSIQNLIAFQATEPGGDISNNELRLDADFNGVGDPSGFLPTSTFSAFNQLPILGTGNQLLLTIEFTADANNEELAIDNIQIAGDHFDNAMVPEPNSMAIVAIGAWGLISRRRRRPVMRLGRSV